jgi:hypothetical protein
LPQTPGVCTICTVMCVSGAGTGMEVMEAVRRILRQELPPALAVWYAEGVGSIRRRASVQPIGATSPHRDGAASTAT